jgi:hypothetical protein
MIAEGHVPTERASRYLVQLCEHVDQLRHHRPGHSATPPGVRGVEWSDTSGVLTFDIGRCALQATPNALRLRVEAAGEGSLQRLQELVAKRLETIGRRDNLQVAWTSGPPQT